MDQASIDTHVAQALDEFEASRAKVMDNLNAEIKTISDEFTAHLAHLAMMRSNSIEDIDKYVAEIEVKHAECVAKLKNLKSIHR